MDEQRIREIIREEAAASTTAINQMFEEWYLEKRKNERKKMIEHLKSSLTHLKETFQSKNDDSPSKQIL